MTAAPPSAFGSMIASGLVGATASRSASTRPVCRLFTRTMRYGRDVLAIASLRKLAAASRARALPSHAIESSRSIINASAPLDIALSSFFALSAGTKRSERIRIYFDRNLLGPHAHERLTAALGHELVILVIGAMMKFDDPGAGARFRFAIVVPTVISETWIPIIKPSVNSEFISGWPHSVSCSQKCRSMCNGCGLRVMLENNMLSICVTVRV